MATKLFFLCSFLLYSFLQNSCAFIGQIECNLLFKSFSATYLFLFLSTLQSIQMFLNFIQSKKIYHIMWYHMATIFPSFPFHLSLLPCQHLPPPPPPPPSLALFPYLTDAPVSVLTAKPWKQSAYTIRCCNLGEIEQWVMKSVRGLSSNSVTE